MTAAIAIVFGVAVYLFLIRFFNVLVAALDSITMYSSNSMRVARGVCRLPSWAVLSFIVA